MKLQSPAIIHKLELVLHPVAAGSNRDVFNGHVSQRQCCAEGKEKERSILCMNLHARTAFGGVVDEDIHRVESGGGVQAARSQACRNELVHLPLRPCKRIRIVLLDEPEDAPEPGRKELLPPIEPLLGALNDLLRPVSDEMIYDFSPG